MGLLTFSINVTLDGCVDHREGIADDETHAFFTRLMDENGAMLWGRVTYEMMESYWPAVARGDEEAHRAGALAGCLTWPQVASKSPRERLCIHSIIRMNGWQGEGPLRALTE